MGNDCYDDQENIEKKIMESNKKQFCLTETSPPMQEPLVSKLGYLTNTNTAEQILQGTYVCPPGVDMHTQQFLASLQFTTPITNENQIPMSVMKEDYQTYWKWSQERTSSSYSSAHFEATGRLGRRVTIYQKYKPPSRKLPSLRATHQPVGKTVCQLC
jgi:hypothetical protein